MSTNPPRALKPLRILDLSQGVAGAYCTKMMAGLGAEVIKVEPPGRGDPLRSMAPFWKDEPHPETSCFHLHLNTGKKSITLDVAQPSGAELLRRLAPQASAVVESFAPGFLSEHGLSYEELKGLNPALVMVSITPFGQTGPHKDWKGNELVNYAAGGYAHLTGLPEREPVKAYGHVVGYHTGMQAAVGGLAALWRSFARGIGEHVDVSVHESVAFLVGQPPLTYLQTGATETRVGSGLTGRVPSPQFYSVTMACADGYLHVHSPTTRAQGADVIGEMMGEPLWMKPELQEKLPPGKDAMEAVMAPWLLERKKDDLMWMAQKVSGPWTSVQNAAEVLADPQHKARGYFAEVDHPVVGKVRQPGFGFIMRDTPWRTDRAPLLGEHNEEVFCQRLGLTSADLSLLRERGVV